MRSFTPPSLAGRCPRCYVLSSWCVCEQIPVIQTPFSVVLLRHYREGFKTTNSGRLALLSLPNSSLLEYGARGASLDASSLVLPNTALLFPGEGPLWPTSQRPSRLIVIDGTWSQARHMVNRIPGLKELPKVSLPSVVQIVPRLRQAAHEEECSTLEAISSALSLFGFLEDAQKLLSLYQHYVTQVLQARGKPTGS